MWEGGRRDHVKVSFAVVHGISPEYRRGQRAHEKKFVEEGVGTVAVCAVRLEEAGMVVDIVEAGGLVDLRGCGREGISCSNWATVTALPTHSYYVPK
jgi:hypothetical protein